MITSAVAWLALPLGGALAFHFYFGIGLGWALLIFFVGLPLLRALINIDDGMKGGWRNPDRTVRPPWLQAPFWGQIVAGLALASCGAALDHGWNTQIGAIFWAAGVLGFALGVPISLRSMRACCQQIDVRCSLGNPNDRRLILQKVCEGIGLIAQYSPLRLARIRRDLRGVRIDHCDGVAEYHHKTRLCLLDFHHIMRQEVTPAHVAASIIHEATHARLMKAGFGYEKERRARIERVCSKAEKAFGSRLPDGKAIVDEALAQMERDPEVWTDQAALARRLTKLRKLGIPEWVIRLHIRKLQT